MEARARQSDALAVALRAGLDRLSSPLARVAAAFVDSEGWKELGFARLEDYARERLGRSGRWVRDLAALGRSFVELPGLEGAVRGTDGGVAIGRVAGLIVGRIAARESLVAWVERARALSVRELREEVAAARIGAGSGDRAALSDAGDADKGADAAPAGTWFSLTGDDGANALPARRVEPVPDRSAETDVRAGLGEPAHDRPAALDPASRFVETDGDDDAGRRLVRFQVPGPVRAAFDEALDLYRAVEGRESSLTDFATALVADSLASGVELPDPMDGALAEDLARCRPVALRERALARSTGRWEHLPAAGAATWALRLARSSLERLSELEAIAGEGEPPALDDQLRALIRLENEIETRIGGLLEQMAEDGAWARLRFDSVAHYAEQRLAMGRTAARMRLRVRRSLRRLPSIKAAYEDGQVGAEAAWLVARMIRSAGDASVDTDGLLERAKVATVKRLRDEARMVEREFGLACRSAGSRDGEWTGVAGEQGRTAADPGDAAAAPGDGVVPSERDDPDVTEVARPRRALPLTDRDWFAGLRREPGSSRRWLAVLGRAAARYRVSDVFLLLRLPIPLATDLLAAVESRRRSIEAIVSAVPWDEPWPEDQAAGSERAGREFFVRCRRTPAWVGLLALLEEFVETWDVDHAAARGASRRPDQEIAIRDGWRCVAPGCTSRRNLDNHHVHYSSRGGSDAPWNRATLCRFHHQRGEHGGLAICRGRAPLGLTWRLGRKGSGGWYRNEIAMAPLRRAGECSGGFAEP